MELVSLRHYCLPVHNDNVGWDDRLPGGNVEEAYHITDRPGRRAFFRWNDTTALMFLHRRHLRPNRANDNLRGGPPPPRPRITHQTWQPPEPAPAR